MRDLSRDEILRQLAARMRDPDRVVLNPSHLYETAGGERTQMPLDDEWINAPRACVAGHLRQILFDDEHDLFDLLPTDALALWNNELQYPIINAFANGDISAVEAAERIEALL